MFRKTFAVVLIIGIVLVLGCGYWIDDSLIRGHVRDAAIRDLQKSMEAVLVLSPSEVENMVPDYDRKNAYNVVNEPGKSYRVIHMNDAFIQQQMRTYVSTFYEEDPTTPVCKITAVTFGYAPQFENAGAFATVQYVDPLGIMESFPIQAIEPLKHISVKQ